MRRVAIVPILAVTLVYFSGCRSTSTPTMNLQEQPKAEPSSPSVGSNHVELKVEADSRPRIVCFGDSLTAGYGTEMGQSYPDFLQTDLDRQGYSYRIVNAGISGNTTKDGLERVARIAAMKPAIVVVEFGGNDGLRGLRIEDTRANLDKILSTLTESGTRVVLAGITLPPDYGQDYIHQFNQTYNLLAKKYRVPMLPFLLKGVFGVDGMMQSDRTHATAAGNKVVAQNVLGLIQPLLKKEPATPSRQ
ncbi:arylesterase [Edaphobacter albus]|uniref:arylesterase n=1 Tax=Edaphobacter sp. 4G125 TaxID=2763071 RepID=UPI001647329D|nr:arylesterase [Edaphobacter sp. 4G125]QNI35691.1 arylesterase [Edaphobacter sp. 4G125]